MLCYVICVPDLMCKSVWIHEQMYGTPITEIFVKIHIYKLELLNAYGWSTHCIKNVRL
jgi:hypothetical protein